MKEGASGALGCTPPCNVPRRYASVVMLPAALLDDLFDRPDRRVTKKGRQNRSRRASKELLRLGRSLGRVLKHTFGAGVVNELASGHQAFGHGHLAPGAQAVREFSSRDRGVGLRCGCVRHGRHSR